MPWLTHLRPLLTALSACSVQSVEHLLSALENCGVDNARIEIEGGPEVPIIDGSALGWVLNVQMVRVMQELLAIVPQWLIWHMWSRRPRYPGCHAQAGLRGAAPGEKEKVRKLQMEPKDVITVRGQNGSFISFFPEQQTRVTYGIDHHEEAPIIGKQWMSWSPDEDEHYRWAIAPARTYAPSIEVRLPALSSAH